MSDVTVSYSKTTPKSYELGYRVVMIGRPTSKRWSLQSLHLDFVHETKEDADYWIIQCMYDRMQLINSKRYAMVEVAYKMWTESATLISNADMLRHLYRVCAELKYTNLMHPLVVQAVTLKTIQNRQAKQRAKKRKLM